MDPITTGITILKVKNFFKKILTSPWFYVILAFIAIGCGTAYYLHNDKEDAVAAAVAGADTKATIQSYETKDEVDRRSQKIDEDHNRLREQTTKDYSNVRNQIQQAPPAERDAQAPALLIDTLNELDRLRSHRDSGGVPDAEVPVG